MHQISLVILVSRRLEGIDVKFLLVLAEKFRLNVALKPEKYWLEKLPDGSLAGTVASVSIKRTFEVFGREHSLSSQGEVSL